MSANSEARRSAPARAIDRAVAAFRTGDVDVARRAAWSVAVTGPAAVVTDAAARDRPLRSGPVSRVPARHEVLVRIEPEPVTGRELAGGRPQGGVEPARVED
ncbi:pyridoxamine 5'-phosphate oxidase family protein [Streptomyces pilosus]|uniref:pyridoxamine 5'-phosphate oxidase family protein n=1 Tax=Streptomyces pilosus TaxID=28893 RepID=UPI003631DE23